MTTTAVSLSYPSTPSPICRLPPELLIDIFVHCSDMPSDQLTPVVLGQVCRYWMDVSHLSPRIWQHVYLYESNGTTVSHGQAERWIHRAHPLPFDVHINVATADMILPLMSPILSHMQRLQRCVISGKHEEEFDFSNHPFDRSRDCLVDELHLLIKGPSALEVLPADSDTTDDRPPTEVFRVQTPPDGSGPPSLGLHFSVYAVPLATAVRPLPIRALCISEFTLDVTTDVPRMLAFLTCTPLLESLHFAGWTQEGAPIAAGVLTPVHLPRLRFLLLRTTVSIRALLAHLHVPALRELHLEHTNVDFALRTEPYVAAAPVPDEGESEDEAHDFSQSPWSDHATGMGLRALLRRSRPPLEVLHMDYADMRTKDFRWAFDRLATLREFRIIGSDMSDRVLAMLAPFRKRRLAFGLPDAEAEDGEARRGAWAVRLPNLETLSIWHCQRISGDAVVNTLRDRVTFTDLAAAEGMGETLESVTVVGCSEFLFDHAQALSDSLGERLRLS